MTTLDWHADRSWPALLDAAPESEGIDLAAVRAYRLSRVRAEMERRDIPAMIVSDPVNIRYATGTRNMQVFTSRNTPSRYLLLTGDRSILYEFAGCEHLAAGYRRRGPTGHHRQLRGRRTRRGRVSTTGPTSTPPATTA